MHGGRPPAWVGVLVAAEDWGMPPWEIAGDGDRVTWYMRWLALKEARAKASQAAEQRARRKYGE